MHKNFLILVWEFTRGGEENQDSFIQKTLKLSKTLKVKSLARPKLDALPKKTAYNLFFLYNMRGSAVILSE